MTEFEPTAPADPNTAGALIEFLDTAIEKGWINVSTAKAMKTASLQLLGVEQNWRDLDLRTLDVDELFMRFRNLKRNKYSDDSMRIYKSRFSKAVQMHLTRVDGGDWRALAPVPRSSVAKAQAQNIASVKKGSATTPTEVRPEQKDEDRTSVDNADMTEAQTHLLMRFPFPLRDNLDVSLALPRDLTKSEAARLNAFISSLARDERNTATTADEQHPHDVA